MNNNTIICYLYILSIYQYDTDLQFIVIVIQRWTASIERANG